MSFVNSISATKTAQVMSKIDTTGAGVSIAGEVDATSIGATLNGVLSQNFATNTAVNNKFVADQAIPLINPFATPFTWNDIASQNFVNTRNFLTLDDVYPVGSIYFTASAVSPSTSIGGSWIRYAEGKCLFGVDDNDSDFSSVEQIGGEKTHTLTKAEIPPHKHIETRMGFDFNPVVSGATSWRPFDNPANQFETSDGSLNLDGTSQLQGLAHNNMPPYIVTYMWKRTT
jgi:hypothetical protein